MPYQPFKWALSSSAGVPIKLLTSTVPFETNGPQIVEFHPTLGAPKRPEWKEFDIEGCSTLNLARAAAFFSFCPLLFSHLVVNFSPIGRSETQSVPSLIPVSNLKNYKEPLATQYPITKVVKACFDDGLSTTSFKSRLVCSSLPPRP